MMENTYENKEYNYRKFFMTALMVIGIGLVFLLLVSMSSSAAIIPWGHPHIVSGTEVYTNDTINAQCGILVPGGTTLRLENTTVNILNGGCWFEVVGGTLEVTDNDGDNTTTEDASEINELWNWAYIGFYNNANVLIENSNITNMGGGGLPTFRIFSSNVTIHHNLITNGDDVFYLNNGAYSANIHNNTIQNSGRALYAYNVNDIDFKDNWVNNSFWSETIYAEYTNLNMANNIIENSPGPAIGFYGNSRTLHMQGDIVRDISGYGLRVDPNSNYLYLYMDDCHFEDTTSWAIYLYGDSSQRIIGNINDTDMVDVNEGLYARYVDLDVDGLDILRTNGYGMQAHYSDIVVNNSELRSTTSHPIGVWYSTGYFGDNTLQNCSATGYYLYDSNVDIDNNFMDNLNGYGVYDYSTLIDLTNSHINGSTSHSYYSDHSEYGSTMVNNKFTNPRSSNQMAYVYYSHHVLFDGNLFDGTRSGSLPSWGLYIYHHNGETVYKNNTFQNLRNGQHHYDSWGWRYTGGIWEGNVYRDITESYALHFQSHYQTGEFVFKDNEFYDVNYHGIYFWLYSYDWWLTIEDNVMENVGYGMYFYNNYGGWYPYPDFTFRNNTIENSPNGHSLYTRWMNTVTLHDCLFTNSSSDGINFRDHRWGDFEVINVTSTGHSSNGMYLDNDYSDRKVIIKNSRFNNNGGNGWYQYRGGYLTVEDSEFIGNSGTGLYARYNYYNTTIKNSKFNKNGNDGLYHQNHQSYMPEGIVENCEFNGNYRGYYSNNGGTHIRNSEFKNNSYEGLLLNGWDSHNMDIHDNVFYDNGNYGIRNEYWASTSSIRDNDFIGNSVAISHEVDSNAWTYYRNSFKRGVTGIYNDEGVLNAENNDFMFMGTGIYSEEGSINVEGNTFTNMWVSAIDLYYTSSSYISNNDIRYCNRGIYGLNSMANTYGNTLIGNGYGIFSNQSFFFVEGDHVADNEVGIYVSPFSFVNMMDVDLIGNSEYGVESGGQNFMAYTVSSSAEITDNKVQIRGGIDIQNGGTLTITDSTIVIDSPGGTGYSMVVQDGGALMATGMDVLAANATREFGFQALAGSNVMLQDCSFTGIGFSATPQDSGLYIMSDDVVLESVTIDGAYNGLYIGGDVEISMHNSSIMNTENLDIYIYDDSILRTGNTEFDRNHVEVLDTSMIIIERIIKVITIDDSNDPYPDVTIDLRSEGSPVGIGTTDSNGMWWDFFEGAIISSDGLNENLKTYSIEVSDGVQSFNDSFILSDDYEKTFEFGIPPEVLSGPTPLTVEEDTLLVVNLNDYFTDNDELTFVVEGASNLMVTFDGYTMEVIGVEDWYGNETLTIVATDTHGLTSSYDVNIIVTPVNDVPVISGVPDQIIKEDSDHVLDILSYIYDPDTPQSGLVVTVDTIYASVTRTTITFNYPTVVIEYVRITVTDAEGGSSQDILVSVIATNDAPDLTGMPIFNATEDVEKVIDLGPYLFDEDTNISLVFITTEAEEVMLIDGAKLTFLFPQGDVQRFVALLLSDGMDNRTVLVEFSVTPVNDPPEIADLPMLTVTEEKPYLFDLTSFISDVDNDISELSISVLDSQITVDGMILIITVDESGAMLTIQITVSDGIDVTTADLRVAIEPVNDEPGLADGKVDKNEGTTDDSFKFTVTFTDPDAEYPTVYVVIDGQRYAMKHVSGDFATGAEYKFSIKLDPGSHSYRFEVDDGSGAPNGQAWTEEKTNLEVQEPMNWIPILLLIIIIAVIAFILMAGRTKKKAQAVPIEELEEEEEEEVETPFTKMDDEALEEEEEEEDEDEDEEEDEEPEEEEEDEEEDVHEASLMTQESEADLEAEDTEAKFKKDTKPKKYRKAQAAMVTKKGPAKGETSLEEKASEGEIDDTDSDETSLEDLMADIMIKKKVKKKKKM